MCQAIGFDQGREAKDSALGHLHDEQQSSKLLPLVAPPYRVRSRDITHKARQAVLFVEGIESVRSPFNLQGRQRTLFQMGFVCFSIDMS